MDFEGNNCPSGDGSVTFGIENTASVIQSLVLGESVNSALGNGSVVFGGTNNGSGPNDPLI